MAENNTTTIRALLRFALPLGTTLLAGDSGTLISWAAMVRAQPPAFPDIYGGELALVSMDAPNAWRRLGRYEDLLRQVYKERATGRGRTAGGLQVGRQLGDCRRSGRRKDEYVREVDVFFVCA